jgi:hypothetical protein
MMSSLALVLLLTATHGNFPRFLHRIVESAERLDNRKVGAGNALGEKLEGPQAGDASKTHMSASGQQQT